MRRVTTVAVIAAGIVCVSLALVRAQTATPKLADGHPDLNGQWYHRIGPPAPQVKPGQSYDAAIAKPIGIAQFNPGKPVYKPELVAKVKDYDARQVEVDPAWYCNPPGVPRIYLHPFPMQIVVTPKELIMLFEYDHNVRHIYTDGRQHPKDLTATYMGDSIGHWEGDTFVIDTVGFNDKTWLDRAGHPHSDQLHVTERLHRTAADRLQIDFTIQDPVAYAMPFSSSMFFRGHPDWSLMEQVCEDNAAFLSFEK